MAADSTPRFSAGRSGSERVGLVRTLIDPAHDIEAITVNRWPHGYAPEWNPLFAPDMPDAQRPNVLGRAQFGRITIANSDAGAFAYTNEAIDQGCRAVQEIIAKRA